MQKYNSNIDWKLIMKHYHNLGSFEDEIPPLLPITTQFSIIDFEGILGGWLIYGHRLHFLELNGKVIDRDLPKGQLILANSYWLLMRTTDNNYKTYLKIISFRSRFHTRIKLYSDCYYHLLGADIYEVYDGSMECVISKLEPVIISPKSFSIERKHLISISNFRYWSLVVLENYLLLLSRYNILLLHKQTGQILNDISVNFISDILYNENYIALIHPNYIDVYYISQLKYIYTFYDVIDTIALLPSGRLIYCLNDKVYVYQPIYGMAEQIMPLNKYNVVDVINHPYQKSIIFEVKKQKFNYIMLNY